MKHRTQMERRTKLRFPINRELRFKLLEDAKIVATGYGQTIDMSSGGIAFFTDTDLSAGNYIELSISWPALLDDSCPMRLVVYGEVVRHAGSIGACTVEKWEFRTGSRQLHLTPAPIQMTDNRLKRWVEYRRETSVKAGASPAMAIA